MTTKLYIAVQGTCTAGPDDNLIEMLNKIAAGEMPRGYSEELGREVSGGSTTLWVRSPSGVYMLDSGDFADRQVLEKSLEFIAEQEKVDSRASVSHIYHTHTHPDHVANNDLFMDSKWIVDYADNLLEPMLGAQDTSAFNGFRKFYDADSDRERGITSDRFTRCLMNRIREEGLTVIDTPGHAKAHKAFMIEDDEVVIINCETGAEFKTPKVILTADSICDGRYLQRYLAGDKRAAVYANQMPSDVWPIENPADREAMNIQTEESIGRILEVADGCPLIYSHGGLARE